jgi:NADH-quinone oxidoreductase subunit N
MKAAAVLFLMRIVALAPGADFAAALPALGALTTLVGAVLALRQRRLQRLLAYSSLAHAGLLILGVGAWAALGRGPQATTALLFYVIAYAFMSNGAFIFLKASGLETRDQLRGYASRRPWLAAAFAVLLLALGGIPPTGGFVAKFLVFWQAVRASLWGPALIAALAALVSLGYYLGLVRDAYFEEPSRAAPGGDQPAALVTAACALGALLLGAAPLLMGARFWR